MSNCDLIGKGQLFDGFGSFDGRRKYQSQDSLQSAIDLPPVATGNEQVATSARGHEDSMSVCSNSSSNDDKDAFQLNMTVRELVDTERIYVKDLHDVVFGYLQNIDRIGILNRQQHKHLFGNIRSIYEFNRKFLGYLEKNMADPVQVSSCFVDFNNEFVIYSDYCTNYPRSVKVLEDLMKDANFVTIVKNEQTKLQHPLPLGTYLFKPVQRILKYHLLLKSMQAYHSADALGHDVIELAVDRMVAIAMFINEMKRRHEMLLRTQELQNLLTGSQFRTDLNSYGDLVLEDTFRLTGVWGERYILLFSKALIMTKKRKDGSLQVKIIIKTSDIMLIESISREPLQFHILAFESPKVRYALQAKTVEQKQLWCQEIKKLMMDNFPSDIPERAKQVVLGSAGTTRESSYTPDKPVKKSAFVRRNYKSMTPEVRSEHRKRRKSLGALSKDREADDVSLKGATVDSKNAVVVPAPGEVEASDERCEEPIEPEFEPEEDDVGDDYDTESKEEMQTPSLIENKSVLTSPMKNRRSQSLDSICEAAKAEPALDETSEIKSFGSQFITDNETSAESDNEEAKPDDDSEVAQPKPMQQQISVRIIPIRADSFRQAIRMDPVEGKTKRTSTLDDVFEDVVSCPGPTSSVIESPAGGVVMRRSSSRSVASPTMRTSSIAETMESRKKRFSRMFDDWDKTVLDSISTVSDLFKSWPMFDEFSDPSVSSYQSNNLKLANRANQLYSSSNSIGDRSTDRVIPIHVETTPLAPVVSNVQQIAANSRPSYSIPVVVQSTTTSAAAAAARNSSSDVVVLNTTASVTTAATTTATAIGSCSSDSGGGGGATNSRVNKSSSPQSVSIPVIVSSTPGVTHHIPMGPFLQKSVPDGRYSQPNFNMPLIVKPTVSIPVLVKSCHSPTGIGKTVPVLTTSDNQHVAHGPSSSLLASRSDGGGGVVKHVQVTSGHSVPIQVHCESKPTVPGHYVPIMVKSVPLTSYKSDCPRTPASSHSIPVTVKCSPSSKGTVDNKPECELGQNGRSFVNSPVRVSAGEEVNNQPTTSSTSSSLCGSTSERYPSPLQQPLQVNCNSLTSATASSGNVNCQPAGDVSKSVAVNALDNNCNCDLTCNDDDNDDDDPLKKMLEEMTVKHQTVRETVRKINNVKPSRSMDVLDSGHVHVLHSESDSNSCDVVKPPPPPPPPGGGSLLCAPLNRQQPPSPGITASELIRQRVHMFEHDLNS